MIATATSLALGYMAGSIPFAWVLTRWVAGLDVRTVGSGNVGAANVLRATNAGVAALVAVLDVAKGAAPVWVAARLGLAETWIVATGLAAILGHLYPIWLGFRGGKGVATSCGVFAVLSPAATTASLLVFVAAVARTRYVSIGSLAACVVLPVASALAGDPGVVTLGAVATAGLIAVRHRDNVRRLREGSEPALGRQ